jgi:AcrR family transcriptional regulator
MTEAPSTSRRGRPPNASPAEVLEVATDLYLGRRRVDIQAVASRLGVGRATIYRWYGSREGLLGAVLVHLAERLYTRSRARARGTGADALLDTFDAINRRLAESRALRHFLHSERAAALRIITSSGGPVHPRIVEIIRGFIEEEVRRGTYDPPMDSETLAYSIVRLAEAFLFNDAIADVRGEVGRLREVEAALLGATPHSRQNLPGVPK